LVEAHIFPLAVYLDDDDAILNREFFYRTPNRLLDFAPQREGIGRTGFAIDRSG
jgi:hypothetical protein